MSNDRADQLLEFPPQHDRNVEMAVLGSWIFDPSRGRDILAIVAPDDFAFAFNQGVCLSLIEAEQEGLIPDPLVLRTKLQARELWDKDRSPGELAEILASVATAANATYYAELLREQAGKRRLWKLCIEGVRDSHNGKAAAAIGTRLEAGWADLKDKLAGGEGATEFPFVSSAELASSDWTIPYLIDGILAKGQAALLAGPMKGCKTTIGTDLGISLASGTAFLGRFAVVEPMRVDFITGESGFPVNRETADRIATARGLRLEDLESLGWSTTLPRLYDAADVHRLGITLQKRRPAVLMVDPCYLMMPAADAGNLMAQGELLRVIGDLCAEHGTTPILFHHTKRSIADPHAPPELGDISWSGYGEYARQWLLLSRRERYEPGSGMHRLWFCVGGSAGHSGQWALDCDEGEYKPGVARKWDVTLSTAQDARNEVQERLDAAKAEKVTTQSANDLDKITRFLAKPKFLAGETKSVIRQHTVLSSGRYDSAVALGFDQGDLESVELNKSNHRKPFPGVRLVQKDNQK